MGETNLPPANPPAEDYAGRRDLGDLRQAYRASGEEAVRQRQRAEAAEQQLAAMQAAANPPAPHGRPSYEDSLETLGLPLRDLDAFVGDRVTRAVHSALQPIAQQLEGTTRARQHMLADYGQDFVKYEQDFAQYLQSNPQVQSTYQRIFNADPVGAAEWGYLKFSESRRREHGVTNGAPPVPEEMPHARVPGGGGGQGTRPPQDPRWDAAATAWDQYQKNPSQQNAERYARARIGMGYSEAFLNGTNRR